MELTVSKCATRNASSASCCVERKDHNFMGKTSGGETRYFTTVNRRYGIGEENSGDSGDKCSNTTATADVFSKKKNSDLTFCDIKAKSCCCENPNFALMKYNKEGKQKSSKPINVCSNLLKMNNTKYINLNNKFVSSFCCYNDTTVDRTSATKLQIRGSKSETRIRSNNRTFRSQVRRGGRSVVTVIMQLCLFLLSCLSIFSYVESMRPSCPISICNCKWKNGKNDFLNLYFRVYNF